MRNRSFNQIKLNTGQIYDTLKTAGFENFDIRIKKKMKIDGLYTLGWIEKYSKKKKLIFLAVCAMCYVLCNGIKHIL